MVMGTGVREVPVMRGNNTIGMSSGGNSAGVSGPLAGPNLQYVLAGGNNITLSQSVDGYKATLTIVGPNVAVGSNSIGMSNLGNSAGTSGIASGSAVRYLFAGGNNVTLSQSINGASGTVTISVPNYSNTFGMYNIGNTAGTAGAASGSQISFLLAGGNNITLSQSLDGVSGTLTISGPNAPAVLSQSGGVSNLGNTAGTSGIASGAQVQFLFAGGNNVTLSQSVNGASATITVSAANIPPIGTAVKEVVGALSTGTITRYAPEDHAHRGVNLIQISGNTLNTSNIVYGSVYFAGGNNITLSQVSGGSAATITISAFNQSVQPAVGSGGISGGNVAGNTTYQSGSIVFAGGNNITLSGATGVGGQTYTISGANAGVTLNEWNNFTGGLSGPLLIDLEATHLIAPMNIPNAISASTFVMGLSIGNFTVIGALTGNISVQAAVYSLNGSTLSSMSALSYSKSWGAGNGAATDWSGYSGFRRWDIPWTANFTPGNYWLGLVYTWSYGSALPMSIALGRDLTVSQPINVAGANGASASQSFMAPGRGGYYSVTTASTRASIAMSDIFYLPEVPMLGFRNYAI